MSPDPGPVAEPMLSEPLFYEQTWDLSYRHALGETASRFLLSLKERRMLGRRCDGCERVLVPPRSFCDRCHRETGDWFEVAHHGEIAMFTIVYEPFKGMPDPPYVIAYVIPDGADTALLGYVRGIELADAAAAAGRLAAGTKVEILFADEPEGKVTDYWFEISRP